MSTLTIQRPDDWHVHLRDGAALQSVLRFTTERFGRAIIMPNLKPPITTTARAAAYRERILAALPAGARFEPLMTLYLTNTTPAGEIDAAYLPKSIIEPPPCQGGIAARISARAHSTPIPVGP